MEIWLSFAGDEATDSARCTARTLAQSSLAFGILASLPFLLFICPFHPFLLVLPCLHPISALHLIRVTVKGTFPLHMNISLTA